MLEFNIALASGAAKRSVHGVSAHVVLWGVQWEWVNALGIWSGPVVYG